MAATHDYKDVITMKLPSKLSQPASALHSCQSAQPFPHKLPVD